jgi:putative ABC transport system substrate-binding protein
VDAAIAISVLPGLRGRTPLELQLAMQRRGVPVVAGWISPTAESFVLQIGADPLDHFRRGVVIAARILSGEKAGEISVDQDSRIFLTANLRAARTLGIKIPKSVLLRADKVIE